MTTTKAIETYNASPPLENFQWAASRMMSELTDQEFKVLKKALTRLDAILYKSWAKELTLSELLTAVNDVRIISDIED